MTHDRVRSEYVVFMPCACCNSGVLHSIHVLKTLHKKNLIVEQFQRNYLLLLTDTKILLLSPEGHHAALRLPVAVERELTPTW